MQDPTRDELLRHHEAKAQGQCNAPPATQGEQPMPNRQGALTALRQRIAQLRGEANELDALYNALPHELPQRADDALWRLLSDFRSGR